MCVADVMSVEMLVVQFDTSVSDALALAAAKRGHYVLITASKRIVGVVCTCELMKQRRDRLVAECVSRPPEVTWPQSSLREAARRFVHKAVGCLPVCDGDTLVGVLTRADIRKSNLPAHELPGGFCCASCGQTHHVRPFGHELGLGICLDCRERGFLLPPYDGPPLEPSLLAS
jgi:predicted transcriptional regulator